MTVLLKGLRILDLTQHVLGLARLYRHAQDVFGFPVNPLKGVASPIVRSSPVHVMSLEEAAALYATVQHDIERAILDLALGHGWRQVEIRRVTAGDVRSIRAGMIFCRGKEREELTPLLPETARLLTQLAADRDDTLPVIRARREYGGGQDGLSGYAVRKILGDLAKRAGLRFKGHDLRRTFATLVTEASGDEALAMRLIRDVVPGVSNRYIKRNLIAALEKYSPLRLIQGFDSQRAPTISSGVLGADSAGVLAISAGVESRPNREDGTPGETRTLASGSGGRRSIH